MSFTDHTEEEKQSVDEEAVIDSVGDLDDLQEMLGDDHSQEKDLTSGSGSIEPLSFIFEESENEEELEECDLDKNNDANIELLLKECQSKRSTGVIVNQTNNTGEKRKWDKAHYCYYCGKKYVSIMRHYCGPHRSQPEVQRILSLPQKSNERTLEMLKLRNAGDFKHNTKVLKKGEGVLVTLSRPFKKKNVADNYLPCDGCLGFIKKDTLWRHRQTCPLIAKNEKSHCQRFRFDASCLLPSFSEIMKGLEKNVVSLIKNDVIRRTVLGDSTILKVGEKSYQANFDKSHLYPDIAQKMKILGQFLISARRVDSSVEKIRDIINPDKFEVVIKAAKALCKYDERKKVFKNRSQASYLGVLLRKCAGVLKSESLISGQNQELWKQADLFQNLCNSRWGDEISRAVNRTVDNVPFNDGR